jgi:hypothetical protein
MTIRPNYVIKNNMDARDQKVSRTAAREELKRSHDHMLAILKVISADVALGLKCPMCGCTPHNERCSLVRAIELAPKAGA